MEVSIGIILIGILFLIGGRLEDTVDKARFGHPMNGHNNTFTDIISTLIIIFGIISFTF